MVRHILHAVHVDVQPTLKDQESSYRISAKTGDMRPDKVEGALLVFESKVPVAGFIAKGENVETVVDGDSDERSAELYRSSHKTRRV